MSFELWERKRGVLLHSYEDNPIPFDVIFFSSEHT